MKPARTILLISILGVAELAGARSAAPATSSPAPADARSAAHHVERSARSAQDPRIEKTLRYARSLIGVKYRYGGNSTKSGFDCSGFVRHVFAAAAGLELPRSSTAMSRRGAAVRSSDLRAGDLVFYNTGGRRVSHVGIYLGNGRLVHAPSRHKAVEIAAMGDRYWKKRFNGARRVLGHG